MREVEKSLSNIDAPPVTRPLQGRSESLIRTTDPVEVFSHCSLTDCQPLRCHPRLPPILKQQ